MRQNNPLSCLSVAFFFFLLVPLNAQGQGLAESYQVVDLVDQQSGQITSCPEASYLKTEIDTVCETSGTIEKIRIEQGTTFTICQGLKRRGSFCENPLLQSRSGRITLLIGGHDFYYLLRDVTYGDLGAPMSLFTASRVNRIPITLRFINWGGEFYITEATL